MTSKKTDSLTAASALDGTELVHVVQSGNSRKSTTQAIADLGTSQDNMTDGTTNKNYSATDKTKVGHLTVTGDVDLDTISTKVGHITVAADIDLGDAVLNTATDASTFGFVVDEDDMASDSATKLPTQQSVKAYVDGKIIDEDDMASNLATKAPSQQSVKAYAFPNAGGIVSGNVEITGTLKIPGIVSALVLADGTGLLSEWGNPQSIHLQLSTAAGDATANATALGAAITALTAGGGGVILLPAGQFYLDSKITKTLSANGSVAIKGAGKQATRLIWTNASGGLAITYPATGNFWYPSGAGVFGMQGIGLSTTAANGGTPLTITGNAALGRPMPMTQIFDVAMYGEASGDYWSGGLSIDTVPNLRAIGVDFAGDPTAQAGNIIAITAPGSPGGGAFQHTYENVTGVYATRAMSISGSGVEGIRLKDSDFTGMVLGVLVSTHTLQFIMDGVHIEASTTGAIINLTGANDFVMKNCLILSDGSSATAVQLASCALCHVKDNVIIGNAAAGGIAFVMAGDISATGPTNVHSNTVTNYNIGYRLQAASKGYRVGNIFTKTVTTPVSDLSTAGDNTIYGTAM